MQDLSVPRAGHGAGGQARRADLLQLHRYGFALPFVAGRDVLDIGSADGFGASLLAETAAQVTALDRSGPAVELAAKIYRRDNLRFVEGSEIALPLEEASVDVVTAFGMIGHTDDPARMLAEIKRVLRPGGTLLISANVMVPQAAGRARGDDARAFSRDAFDGLLAQFFTHRRMHPQKVLYGSVIGAEGPAALSETDAETLAQHGGVIRPEALVAVVSDRAFETGPTGGLMAQNLLKSPEVLQRIEREKDRQVRDITASVAQDFDWISAQIGMLQKNYRAREMSLAKFLRRLLKARVLYALSRASWISERKRKKMQRSAEKRDPMLFARRMDEFCDAYFERVKQNTFLTEAAQRDLVRHGLRVTAVVPNYNHARFLRQRLDSILSQTYPLIDIIVLDDCSTDDSREVIEEYRQRFPNQIRAVYNVANSGGVFRQWQKGYELATGDFVWFCESDDFCEPDFVTGLLKTFRDPSVMLAFGRIEFVDGEGRGKPGMAEYLDGAEPGLGSRPLIRPAAEWFANGFGVRNVIANVGGSIWRRVPLPQTVWDEARQYRVMGDWYLYSAVARGGQIAFVPSSVAYFRMHGQNTSGQKAQATPDYYREYTMLMTALKRRWAIPDATVRKFVESCRGVYRGARLDPAGFDALVPAETLQAVPRTVPHVLIGLLGFNFGGGEIFPIHLANALHRRGIAVSVLQMTDSEDRPEVVAMLDRGIPVYKAEQVREMGPANFLRAAGVSVVHSHVASIEMLFLDRQGTDVPYIATLHGSYESMQLSRRKIQGWATKIDRFTYLTDRNLSVFDQSLIDDRKFVKLRNAMPVDPNGGRRTRADLAIPADAVVFTLVARGIEGKGWLEAVEAVQRLRKRRPEANVVLLAAGAGPLADAARLKAQGDPAIRFLGFDSDIHGLYRLSDVALIPSRFSGESFPLCLIEAMQMGVPATATDIGEISAMLGQDGRQAGLLVPYSEEDETFVAALVDTMDQMLDPELRQRLAADAAALGAGYSMDALAADYEKIYLTTIAEHEQGRSGMPRPRNLEMA